MKPGGRLVISRHLLVIRLGIGAKTISENGTPTRRLAFQTPTIMIACTG